MAKQTVEAIAGFFRTRAEGEGAREALLSAGFSSTQVNYVAGDTRGHALPAVGPIQDSGADSEAPRDAWIGGAAGLAAGIVALAIPGIGPLLAAGPLAAALGGLAAGTAAGGIIGLLKDHGVSQEEAEFYAEGVRRGGALVTVSGVSEDREKDVREIFDRNGAIGVETLAEEMRASA
jgi:hypothetical protein